MIFVGENLQAKVAYKLFGQVRRNSGKNPSHPQKFACSYTYGRNHPATLVDPRNLQSRWDIH